MLNGNALSKSINLLFTLYTPRGSQSLRLRLTIFAKTLFCRQFRKGSVIRMEMKNFMTYAHAVIEPGPHLNLVLGPNGKLSTVYTIYTLHANAYFI